MPEDDQFRPIRVPAKVSEFLARRGMKGVKTGIPFQFEGEEVEHLQQALIDLSFQTTSVDGQFGEDTDKAARKFQSEHKDWSGDPLPSDGIVGPLTAISLNRALVGIRFPEFMVKLRHEENVSREEREEKLAIVSVTGGQQAGEPPISPIRNEAKLLSITTVEKSATFDSEKGERIRLQFRQNRTLPEHELTLIEGLTEAKPLSFEGKARFRVLDEAEEVIAQGQMTDRDTIRFTSKKTPIKVTLEMDQDPRRKMTFSVKEAEPIS